MMLTTCDERCALGKQQNRQTIGNKERIKILCLFVRSAYVRVASRLFSPCRLEGARRKKCGGISSRFCTGMNQSSVTMENEEERINQSINQLIQLTCSELP
jgi:hypothetical protein